MKAEHVVARNNGAACLHCGRSVEFKMPIAVDDFVAMSNAFVKTHAKCRKPSGELCAFCHRYGHWFIDCPTVDTPSAWYESRDTGLSSLAIYLTFRGIGGKTEFPIDPDDFGRCYRLVKRFPEVMEGMARLGERSKVWARLFEHWDELCALFEEELPTGSAPKLYARMGELGTHG
ncbi:MAG: hypothetical protein JNJ59_09525 [Deltaproteobacteria bacterium]|nr:hypothetical protein [Deltaproteobacteria bacterium]